MRGENYCGIAGRGCEYRHNMNTSDCVECRFMLLMELIKELGEKK